MNKDEKEIKPIEQTEKIKGGFNDTEAKLDSVDNILTKVTKILKKHWIIIILILIGYGCYQFVLLVKDEMNKPKFENVQENDTTIDDISDEKYVKEKVIISEPYIVKEYDEQQEDGSFLRIILWSDGVETIDKDYHY